MGARKILVRKWIAGLIGIVLGVIAFGPLWLSSDASAASIRPATSGWFKAGSTVRPSNANDLVIIDALELTEDDTDPACASGNYNLYADLSETVIKVCQDGVTAVLGTGGAGASEWTDTGTVLHPTELTDDVSLGSATLTNAAKLSIDGDADQVQFSLQGNATQTTSLVVIENSAGVDQLTLSNVGVLGLGTDLAVTEGGTGAGTFTDGGILLGSGAGAFTPLGVAGNGEIPIGDGATDPVLATITGTANEITVTNGAGSITLDLPANVILTGDTVQANATGIVVGHTAQITTTGNPSELQVLGTGSGDAVATLGRFSADVSAPGIHFVKSRNATIGSNAILVDNDKVGALEFYPDDGVDHATVAARFRAEVDDATPAAGDIGMAYTWEQMPGGGGALAETMRLSAAANLGIGIDPTTTIHADSNGADTVAISTLENTGGNVQDFITSATPEGAITGSIGDIARDHTNGMLYFKQSGSATNTGWEAVGGLPTFKSYSLSNPGNADTFYVGGHYGFAAADANLTIGGTVVQTFGAAGEAHGAHAFAVASGAGGTDLVLTVTGVSITEAGVRNASDSEIIVADADTAVTDQYFETTKKWLGQITYTLTGAAGTFDFNYGFASYEDFGNREFTVTDFEATGEMRANETGLNIELLHHEAGAFVYHVSAFVPNQTALISLAADYSTDNDVASGIGFAYKRRGFDAAIAGSAQEGLIIRVTTVVNNSVNDASFHIGALVR